MTNTQTSYTQGEWHEDNITQYGVHIHSTEAALRLEDAKVAVGLQEVAVGKRKWIKTDDPLTERDQVQERGLCGQRQWLRTQTMPQILVLTAELQAKIPTGTVRVLQEVSCLVKRAKEGAEDGARGYGHQDPWIVCWHDAAWATGIIDRSGVETTPQKHSIVERAAGNFDGFHDARRRTHGLA